MNITFTGMIGSTATEIYNFLLENKIPYYTTPSEGDSEDFYDVHIVRSWLVEIKISGDEIQQWVHITTRTGNHSICFDVCDFISMEVI